LAIALDEQTRASQYVAQASFDPAQWLHRRHSVDQPVEAVVVDL
jgi:hypothetical protein